MRNGAAKGGVSGGAGSGGDINLPGGPSGLNPSGGSSSMSEGGAGAGPWGGAYQGQQVGADGLAFGGGGACGNHSGGLIWRRWRRRRHHHRMVRTDDVDLSRTVGGCGSFGGSYAGKVPVSACFGRTVHACAIRCRSRDRTEGRITSGRRMRPFVSSASAAAGSGGYTEKEDRSR